MRANELRIGNFIESLKEGGTLGMTYVVRKIEDNIINSGIIKYTPIPIDEYWLWKCGFELFDYEPSSDGNDDDEFIYLSYKLLINGVKYYYTVTNTDGLGNSWDFCIKLSWDNDEVLLSRIQYVHQLQNLYFALTNEELTLKP